MSSGALSKETATALQPQASCAGELGVGPGSHNLGLSDAAQSACGTFKVEKPRSLEGDLGKKYLRLKTKGSAGRACDFSDFAASQANRQAWPYPAQQAWPKPSNETARSCHAQQRTEHFFSFCSYSAVMGIAQEGSMWPLVLLCGILCTGNLPESVALAAARYAWGVSFLFKRGVRGAAFLF